jgi:hypothetical protein
MPTPVRTERLGQHPAGTLADQLVDQGRSAAVSGSSAAAAPGTTVSTGSYLPDRRWRAGLANTGTDRFDISPSEAVANNGLKERKPDVNHGRECVAVQAARLTRWRCR